MRKTILAVLGCVAAVLVLAVVIWRQNPAPNPIPALNVETIDFDFGPVRAHTVVHHDFEMHNNGSEPRLIDGVSTTCSCTTTGNVAQVIPPHSTRPLPVDVNLKGVGKFRSKVIVAFKDESQITVVITGDSVQQFPPELKFEKVPPGGIAERRFSIRSMSSAPLKVKSTKCDNPNFEVSVFIPTSSTSPADPEILVRFHAPSTGDEITGKLHVETDDEVQPEKVIALVAQVRQVADTK
jgi:hypothetical protein